MNHRKKLIEVALRLEAINNTIIVQYAVSVTISVPRANQFTVEALRGIMERLGRGERP